MKSIINILKGKFNKKQMASFAGVKLQELDVSLDHLSNLGYLKYEKIRGGKYQFVLYPEPIREIQLTK